MIVSIKDGFKLFGIAIMVCCAVTVCHMFLNYYLDLLAIEDEVTAATARILFDAQAMNAKVVCFVTGGCLVATTVVMLLFYLTHYIDSHTREIGILKAMGYSDFQIARGFAVFGLSVFLGTVGGFFLSLLLMPQFYDLQNEGGILPDVTITFHPLLFVLMVLLPPLFFAAIAVFGSIGKLHQPCARLLKGIVPVRGKRYRGKDKQSFLAEMRASTLRSRKALVFFISFAAFCFAAMTQMSTKMRDLSSEMMGLMILIIGLVLAFTTMYIAIATVSRANAKNVALMRVFGYDAADCKSAVLNGYRPWAGIGFLLGSAYQYLLLKTMVEIVFKDFPGIPPEFEFDVPIFLLTLVAFIVIYEGFTAFYAKAMKKIPLKEIMDE